MERRRENVQQAAAVRWKDSSHGYKLPEPPQSQSDVTDIYESVSCESGLSEPWHT